MLEATEGTAAERVRAFVRAGDDFVLRKGQSRRRRGGRGYRLLVHGISIVIQRLGEGRWVSELTWGNVGYIWSLPAGKRTSMSLFGRTV